MNNIDNLEKELLNIIIPLLTQNPRRTADKILLDGIAIGMKIKADEIASDNKDKTA